MIDYYYVTIFPIFKNFRFEVFVFWSQKKTPNAKKFAGWCWEPACHHPPRLQIEPPLNLPSQNRWRFHLVGRKPEVTKVALAQCVVLFSSWSKSLCVESDMFYNHQLTWRRTSYWPPWCDRSSFYFSDVVPHADKDQHWAHRRGWSTGWGTDPTLVDSLCLSRPFQRNAASNIGDWIAYF